MYFKMPFASTTSASICKDRTAAEVMQKNVCNCMYVFSSMIEVAHLFQCNACVTGKNDNKPVR